MGAMRTHCTYARAQLVLQNKGLIEARYSLRPSPSVSAELAAAQAAAAVQAAVLDAGRRALAARARPPVITAATATAATGAPIASATAITHPRPGGSAASSEVAGASEQEAAAQRRAQEMQLAAVGVLKQQCRWGIAVHCDMRGTASHKVAAPSQEIGYMGCLPIKWLLLNLSLGIPRCVLGSVLSLVPSQLDVSYPTGRPRAARPVLRFRPEAGVVPPQSQQVIEVTLCSERLGDFVEEASFDIQGSSLPLSVAIVGRVLPPTYAFDAAALDLGTVAHGFLASGTVALLNTSEIPLTFSAHIRGDGQFLRSTLLKDIDVEGCADS